MTEEGKAVPEPERYYVEHVSPASGEEDLSMAAVQEAMNEGTRQSWKLVSVVNEPAGRGVLLVWDQQGFISG
ncbi:MAG TPA: hypothetical protein VNA27_01880 [Rubrobacteraceae bacterium]|nr:hypothetical protein [Rubrobacteraceae bacterium]